MNNFQQLERIESERYEEPVGRVRKKIHAHIHAGHGIGELVEVFLPRAVHFCIFMLGGDHEHDIQKSKYPNKNPDARKM